MNRRGFLGSFLLAVPGVPIWVPASAPAESATICGAEATGLYYDFIGLLRPEPIIKNMHGMSRLPFNVSIRQCVEGDTIKITAEWDQ